MRTTITVPESIVAAARRLAPGASFSEFAREALRERVERLERQRVAVAMDEGYRAEAAELSLDPAWSEVEVEGW